MAKYPNPMSVTGFFTDRPPAKYKYVGNLNALWYHFKKMGNLQYMNVYNRKEKRFLKRFTEYPNIKTLIP